MEHAHLLIRRIEDDKLWEKQLTISRNEYIKVSGSVNTNLYFVISGSLRIFVFDKNEEHTIRFGYKNNIIASLDSFISEKPSELYIQAIKKSEVKIISKKSLKKLIASSNELQQNWNEILEQLILQQMERERDLLTSSPTERYKRVLQRSPQLFQEIPNKYIASYLRMAPETLSRMKKS